MEWFKAAEKFNEALASSDPTPGGGAAAAMVAAMGYSLALMAARTTCKKKATSQEVKDRLSVALHKLAALKVQLNHFIEEDGEAYSAFVAAKQLPKEDSIRPQAMQEALIHAARVPMDTATTAIECLHELEPIVSDIAPIILSDIYCAQHLLKTSIRCCVENIKANLAFIQDEKCVEKYNRAIELFLKSC
ncbi:MAG: cyclodeaminase/cyclohydrolase family protein [Elusimicrobiaceae bacterium]|nr:cyclodeaminase/cyclohydrolase family protein [Elusimicrobiaceae bacterium]